MDHSKGLSQLLIITILFFGFSAQARWWDLVEQPMLCGKFQPATEHTYAHLEPRIKIEIKENQKFMTLTHLETLVSEKLYFYHIDSYFVEEGNGFWGTMGTDPNGFFVNFDDNKPKIELDEDGFPIIDYFPSRFGLYPESGQLFELSNSPKQNLVMWGEWGEPLLLNESEVDGMREAYYKVYYSSLDENGVRLEPEELYCSEYDLDGLQQFFMHEVESFTHYDNYDNVPDSHGFELDLLLYQYTSGVICDPSVVKIIEYPKEESFVDEGSVEMETYQEMYNRCPINKMGLLWVLQFMEQHKHNFDFEKLRDTVIHFKQGVSVKSGWKTDPETNLEYLEINPKKKSRFDLLNTLKQLVGGKEK